MTVDRRRLLCVRVGDENGASWEAATWTGKADGPTEWERASQRSLTGGARHAHGIKAKLYLQSQRAALDNLTRSAIQILGLTHPNAVCYERARLRHPTFQRIFGRTEEARGAGSTLGLPLYAISRSNWSPESAEVRPLFKAPREDGSWFRAELDCS
jgi:hypothetical protein